MKAFFNDVKKEWKHISWLSKKDGARQMAVVAISCAVLGVMISGIDFLGQNVVNLLLGIHF